MEKGLTINLEGQVALVTGASRGIGRAVAIQLARCGAHVAINYQSNEQAAREVLDAVRENGGSGELKPFDVADLEQALKACKEILDEHGRIDILVNNAGITRDQLFVRMKAEEWRAVIDTNLTGAFNCSRAVAKAMMKQRSGCIINMASIAGLTGNPSQANYSAAKAGLIGLTMSMAKELASRSIRVNAIAPGFIQTEMTDKLSDQVKEEGLAAIPMKRFGAVEEVAWIACFLAAPESGYITGQTVNVSGGLYI